MLEVIPASLLPGGVLLAVFPHDLEAGFDVRLPEAALGELARLKTPGLRAERRAALAGRRRALSALIGVEPDSLSLERTREGAPLLLAPEGWSVSFSDIAGFGAVAAARGARALGVDLARPAAIAWQPMLDMICDADSAAAFRACWAASPDALEAFHRLWTIKEAALKASGRGMRAGAKNVPVAADLLAAPGAFRLTALGLDLAGATGAQDGIVASLVAGPAQA